MRNVLATLFVLQISDVRSISNFTGSFLIEGKLWTCYVSTVCMQMQKSSRAHSLPFCSHAILEKVWNDHKSNRTYPSKGCILSIDCAISLLFSSFLLEKTFILQILYFLTEYLCTGYFMKKWTIKYFFSWSLFLDQKRKKKSKKKPHKSIYFFQGYSSAITCMT